FSLPKHAISVSYLVLAQHRAQEFIKPNVAAQLKHGAVSRRDNSEIRKHVTGDGRARQRPVLAVFANDVHGVMQIGRRSSDIDQDARTDSRNAGTVQDRAAKTLVRHFGRRPDASGKAATKFADAFLVDQVVQIGPANSFEHKGGPADQT